MAKDPAFLFYHHDFLVGTAFMSLSDRGAYITILCYMASKGKLTTEEIKQIAGDNISTTLSSKFKRDENDLWFNVRLFEEVEKRKSFCESRRISRMSNVRKRHVKRTVNANEDVINNTTTPIKEGIVKGNQKELYLSAVYLTKEEHSKLINRFGDEGVKQRIYDLNNGIMSKGYKYKSHYHTILSWERRHERLTK